MANDPNTFAVHVLQCHRRIKLDESNNAASERIHRICCFCLRTFSVFFLFHSVLFTPLLILSSTATTSLLGPARHPFQQPIPNSALIQTLQSGENCSEYMQFAIICWTFAQSANVGEFSLSWPLVKRKQTAANGQLTNVILNYNLYLFFFSHNTAFKCVLIIQSSTEHPSCIPPDSFISLERRAIH